MRAQFSKPDMKFTFYQHGLLSTYLNHDYDNIMTFSDLVDFLNKWIIDFESSENEYRKKTLAKVIFPLYSMVTGKSYETKIFEGLIN